MHLEVRSVTKTFRAGTTRRAAVQDVSFEARGGEVIGLLGPNGAGKTTLIRMTLGILSPDSGEILIDGKGGAKRIEQIRRRSGYIPEDRGLYSKRKVIDVLVFLAQLRGLSRQEARRRSDALLEEFDLARYKKEKVEVLSKGLSQRLQLASALVHRPDLLILDEPTAGLDPVSQRLVRDVLKRQAQMGHLVILSSHNMNEVETICDQVVMIHRGQRVLYGPLDTIRREYSHPYLAVDKDCAVAGMQTVERYERENGEVLVFLREGASMSDFLGELAADKREVRSVRQGSAHLEEIFLALAKDTGPTE